MKFLKTFESYGTCYYRSSPEFLGETVEFEPNGYYEEIDNDDDPIFLYGEHSESGVPEVCASKYIGGCVLGNFSMTRSNLYFIYEICEKPDRDISHWDDQDFGFLEEVRYRRNVTGKYKGKVILSKYQKDTLTVFYILKTYSELDEEPPDEFFEKNKEILDKLDDDELTNELKRIKPV